MWLVLFLLCTLAPLAGAERAAPLAEAIRKLELDPQSCYRVREISLTREDLRFYLTEGYIIFAKPVAGRRIAAFFTADTEGGDAELLVMPPTQGERLSLATFTGSPTLNEHFLNAVFLFTDDTGDVLMNLLRKGGEPPSQVERGLVLKQESTPVVGNLAASFLARIVQQLAAQAPPEEGFFYAAVQGRTLGNLDAYYDPVSTEQIYVGSLRYKDTRAFYDVWNSFTARSVREGKRTTPPPGFHMRDFRIRATLDKALHLKVTTTATIEVGKRPQQALAFDLSERMRVTSARIGGREAELFRRDSLRANLLRRGANEILLVLPEQALAPGSRHEIEFEHEGDVVHNAGRDVYFVGSRGNWYPRADYDFAAYDMTFTYPAHLQLVFPGKLEGDRTEGEERTTRRVTENPIRLAGFNLGRYESVKQSRGKLSVEVFANKRVEPPLAPSREVLILPPNIGPFPRRRPDPLAVPLPAPPAPDPAARLEELTAEIAGDYDFLASHLGPPALSHLTVSPIPGGFGQGFPGLVYLSTLSYLSARDRPASVRGERTQVFFDEILHSHEVAHQWWGNVVTAASPEDEWLMEALANYSALLALEKKKGTRTMVSVLDQYRERLTASDGEGKTVESAGPIRLGTRLESSLSPGAWHTIVYEKGTWIMHMLRRRLGDPAFFKLLGDICRTRRHQRISTAEFREMAAAALSPKSPDPKLEVFFGQWVESTGIPRLSMTTAVRGKAPNLKLSVTVSQTEVDEKASVLVPVEVQLGRGRNQTHWIATDAEPVTLTIPVRQRPLKVTLDPDSSVLCRK